MPRDAVPTVAELEARIDEAVVIARVSEEGVREVGEMAIDAARQARRAAEAAEKSANSAAEAVKEAASMVAGPAGPVPDLVPPPLSGRSPKSAPPAGRDAEKQTPTREVVIDPLKRFNDRADALVARLERLQQS